ncbi:MAG: glutamate racemase [Alphaproteobacteria bacterium]|nr:glutamate racemase [Alphaproteobacteria bacterium]
MLSTHSIGIFDSGVGGLTIFDHILQVLPEYNYIYLGDNARAPYGNHSFETILEYSWQATQWLFEQNCQLIIVACNTASAKALRTIQQKYLPHFYPNRKILGIIRPTAEVIGQYSITQSVGLLATQGTIVSKSYDLEVSKFFPNLNLYKQACPLLVPLIENNDIFSAGGIYFVEKYVKNLLNQSSKIDTILLGCTHYPIIKTLIENIIKKPKIKIINQGPLVAESLKKYLLKHTEIENLINKQRRVKFYTTEDTSKFLELSKAFFKKNIEVEKINLVSNA